VCRATSGPDAPDLGVRVATTSGLSGACLQTGTIQQCGDTETDPRINAVACRRLGVRSILVMPLGDGLEPFGVLEVFSSLVNAFGEREIGELQILAGRVVAHKQEAEAVAGVAPSGVPPEVAASAAPPRPEETQSASAMEPKISPELEASRKPEQISESAAESLAGSGYRGSIWTPVLGILVIVTAVLLGLALGWRGAIVRGLNGGGIGGSRASSAATANRGGDSGVRQERAVAASSDLVVPTKNGSPSQSTSVEPPNGGLVVTQNDKVIYRFPVVEAAGAIGSQAMQDADGSASRLIDRVEPLYPTEARAQKIQGQVTLEVQIGSEGAVHNIEVVEGNPMLAAAAVQAVRQWRYRPFAVDGRPAEMQTRVTIRFTLPAS
jgi:TonB family protein